MTIAWSGGRCAAEDGASEWAIAGSIRRERDAGRLTYDGADRPAAGTGCQVCLMKGGPIPSHYCPAKGYLGEYVVCEACGRGEVCAHAVALDEMRNGSPLLFEADVPLDPGRRVELTETELSQPIVQAHPWSAVKSSLSEENLRGLRMTRRERQRASNRRVELKQAKKQAAGRPEPKPAEMRRRMENEQQGVAAAEPCECGKPKRHVGRCKGGGWPEPSKGVSRARASSKATPKLPVSPEVSPVSVKSPVTLQAEATGLVTMTIPAAALDRFWQRLPLEEKVRIVSAEIYSSLAAL